MLNNSVREHLGYPVKCKAFHLRGIPSISYFTCSYSSPAIKLFLDDACCRSGLLHCWHQHSRQFSSESRTAPNCPCPDAQFLLRKTYSADGRTIHMPSIGLLPDRLAAHVWFYTYCDSFYFFLVKTCSVLVGNTKAMQHMRSIIITTFCSLIGHLLSVVLSHLYFKPLAVLPYTSILVFVV